MESSQHKHGAEANQAIVRLQSVTTQARRRLAVRGALGVMSRWFPLSVLFLTPWALLYRLGFISGPVFVSVLLLTSTLFLGRIVRTVVKGPSLLAAALLLDRAHQLSGRLANALEFSGFLPGRRQIDSPERRAYSGLLIDEALAWGEVSAKKAVPVPVPGGLYWGLLMLLALMLLVVVPLRVVEEPRPADVKVVAEQKSRWVSQDDAELLQRSAQEFSDSVDSEEGQKAAARFNEIVLEVVSGELTQAEALRLAAELQADLAGAFAEAEEFRAGLEKRGESLEKRAITREIGEALREQRYQDAEEAFKRLAERLTKGTDALSEHEMNELRESLEEARKQSQESEKSENEEATQNDKLRKSLEQKRDELSEKKKQGKASAEELKELAKTERELKRLDRQKASPKASEELSELDRELAKAAQELAREQKKSGQFLDQAGQKVGQAGKRQLSDKEKREMLKQIEEMKERLRRQNQDGKESERLRKFQEQARGQQGGQQGQQKSGQGQSGQPGEMRLGPDGTPMPVPGEGQGQGEGKDTGREGEGQGEDGSAGREPGHGHDENLAGEESRLKDAKAEDAAAVAQDSGAGESASETIRTAAEEGFSSGAYERLFREYRTVAEEVMDKETVPPGRKAHVRRYFELIRPRGDSPESAPQKEQK